MRNPRNGGCCRAERDSVRTVRGMNEPERERTSRNDTRPAWLWRWTIGVIALWFVARAVETGLGRLHDLLIMLLVSLLVACALEPSVNGLAKRGWKRGAATATLLFGTIGVCVGAIVASGAVVVGQAGQLVDSIPDLIETLTGFARRLGVDVDTTNLRNQITDKLQESVTQSAGDVLLSVVSLLGQFSAGAFIVFYLVADGPRLRRSVCSALPARHQEIVLDVWTTAIVKAGGYLSVRAVLAVLSFIFSWVAFAVMGVPYAAALAVWVALVSQLVPVIGAYIGAALPIVVATADRPSSGLWVLIFIVAYQQLENMFFSPRLNRELMSVHPAIGLLAVLGGAALAGAAGALIALPLVATIQAVLSASLDRHVLVESELFSSNHVPRLTRRRDGLKKRKTASSSTASRSAGDGSEINANNRSGKRSTTAKQQARTPAEKKTAVKKAPTKVTTAKKTTVKKPAVKKTAVKKRATKKN